MERVWASLPLLAAVPLYQLVQCPCGVEPWRQLLFSASWEQRLLGQLSQGWHEGIP